MFTNKPSTKAKGITTMDANIIPTVTALPPSIILEIRPPKTMYPAQNAPASNASNTPIRSTPLLFQGAIKAIPTPAKMAQRKSSARLEPDKARTKGPINSKATPKPKGILSIAR
ncbi:hypothetical protein D9M68_882130 [compost metagenome]